MTDETQAKISPADDSVGFVETKVATLFEPPHELALSSGQKLGPITIAYETYGQLSPNRDNAVYVCHALTGDAHAAGWRSPDSRKPGWWDEFIGPGKGLDTNKYFVICANCLGGCQGTTGPSSFIPGTEKRFGLDFPFITIADIVKVQSELARHLGIEKLLGVIGGSLGGMQALEWAAQFPDQLDSVLVLASAANLSAQGIAFNAVGRRAIYVDPKFNNGQYYDSEDGPRYGLSLARMVAHITYLSESSIEQKFGRRLQDKDAFEYNMMNETEFQIESYLHYQGKRFVQRFDANSYLYLTRAMDYFNLNDSYGSVASALKETSARFLLTSYTTDWLFPTAQSQVIVSALLRDGKHVVFTELDSPFGHDSFLLEFESLKELVKPFLENVLAERRADSPTES